MVVRDGLGLGLVLVVYPRLDRKTNIPTTPPADATFVSLVT